MTTPSIRFVKSAVLIEDLPQDLRPEIAIVGRSNAGKSSLINGMYGTKVAKVSSTPGKTRTINFFDVGPSYRVVDMPGYGFAARAWSERDSWKRMIEDYLSVRSTLVGLILVMDIRRDWEEEEAQLVEWLRIRELPLLVALAKSDKIGKTQIENRRRKLSQSSHLPLKLLFPSSVLKKTGLREIEDYAFRQWVLAGKEEQP